jgi:hypothetical protein
VSESVQTSFATALLAPGRPAPASVMSSNSAPARRFAVYRNNVVVGLTMALQQRFPAVQRVVGTDFFAGMARAFVRRHPPCSPILMTYGDAFPPFIAKFAPAAELPYLADLARLEAARTRAYHAADAVPIDTCSFQGLHGETLAAVRIALHPSAEIVRSPHPIVTIWAMNAGEREPAPIADWRGEDALVARPALDVEVRMLPPGGAAFLLALAAGRALADSAEAAIAEIGDFDLATNLAGLIGSRLVVGLGGPKPSTDMHP